MTPVALIAVLAEVPIVLAMATSALLRHFSAAGRFSMAFGALQFAVRADQRKMRLFSVVEDPDGPAVR